MNKKYNITKKFLIKAYIQNNKSSIDIAKIFNCNSKTIRNYLHKYNILVRLKENVFNFKGRKHTQEEKDKIRKANYKGFSIKRWNKRNEIKLKEYAKVYRKENREKIRAYDRKWHKEHRNKDYENDYKRNKYHNDIHYQIRQCISSIIRKRLKKRLSSKEGQSINKYLPFTIDMLIIHLQNQFKKGMNWDNYGKVWEIDHVVPDCNFNYKTMNDKGFQDCWNLNNLQPLFANENRRKSGKI